MKVILLAVAAACACAPWARGDDSLLGTRIGWTLEGAHRHCDEEPTPYLEFGPLATSLGAKVDAHGGCVYGIGALAAQSDRERQAFFAWLKSPHSSPSDPAAQLPDHESDWACVMLKDNLEREGQSGCQPSLESALRFAQHVPRYVHGEMAFLAFWRKKYRYSVSPGPEGTVRVTVRVAFKGDLIKNPKVREELQRKLDAAASVWTEHSPDGKISFRFQIVPPDTAGATTVNLVDHFTRGPYDTKWSTIWPEHTLAHELGHVMGLDDEYNQLNESLGIGKTTMQIEQCSPGSLMCEDQNVNTVPKPYHYYLILRRVLCPWLGDLFAAYSAV